MSSYDEKKWARGPLRQVDNYWPKYDKGSQTLQEKSQAVTTSGRSRQCGRRGACLLLEEQVHDVIIKSKEH